MRISEIKLVDEGEYICTAQNSVEENSASVNIIVQGNFEIPFWIEMMLGTGCYKRKYVCPKTCNVKTMLKAGCSVFNAGCNEQVFLLNYEKKIGIYPFCRFWEKTQKPLKSDALQFQKNDVTKPKARLL